MHYSPGQTRPAAIAFGANLDSPLQNILMAEDLIKSDRRVEFVKRSSLWLTEPVGGPPGQDWYHNQVVLYNTKMSPLELIHLLLRIESELGRIRYERWGPRLIDLDLLFLGDIELESELISLPHPRLQERAFVLEPLQEVAPDWIHPKLGLNPTALLEKLPQNGPKTIKQS
ncbi:MAG: 2-amino-4-hydroxy-6-hydroxymethyldihydropteridine diphosphokinase [Deltaproteobacteria bacterium]|jgi:2-amino-4-hydroxy-6-hydroxymethyldihydropteridine diphosphokinase|nr:2-amino-4-hydroxy-6-hydroxymethyldihydropteridine diphosphokinase [Deltaproteobacteria bacterium]